MFVPFVKNSFSPELFLHKYIFVRMVGRLDIVFELLCIIDGGRERDDGKLIGKCHD